MSDRVTIDVDLGERSYPIHVGAGLLTDAGALIRDRISRPNTVIVTDETVAALHLEALKTSFANAGISCDAIVLLPGEATKRFEVLESLCGDLLDVGVERNDTIIAFGGGVIGDLTGFAAAILRRGIEFIQIPTTLLAQVDSSVGGKTGINVSQGKNLIGAFHQPRMVIADTDVLDTLDRRELLAGYAEVVKYGVIDMPEFFEWLEANGETLLAGDAAARAHAISICCEAKARIVAEDERESGKRALLNLGHTFGHALEAECGYDGRLLHGEAVALGMIMAMTLSARLGHSDAADTARLQAHLEAIGLPTKHNAINATWDRDRLMAHMAQDKKVTDGRVTYVLVHGIGEAFLSRDVEPNEVADMLDAVLAQ